MSVALALGVKTTGLLGDEEIEAVRPWGVPDPSPSNVRVPW
jgi:hypothetical protein